MQSVRRAWSTGFQRSRAVQRDGRVHRSRAGADVAARGAPVAAQAAREGGEEADLTPPRCCDRYRTKIKIPINMVGGADDPVSFGAPIAV